MLHISTRFKQVFFLFCCGLLWQSCNVINPAEKVPTYIHIDSFRFKANPLWPNLPTTSSITNVKVYYNNNPVGTFDLPCTVPIIAEGNGTLEVAPGINLDGLNNLTTVYPFYQIDTFGFAAQPGKIINFSPVTSFYTSIVPYLISDFSGNTLFSLDAGNISMAPIFPPDPNAFNGGTGSIQLLNVGDSSVDSTIKDFAIPKGENAYIEFDYKSTIPFYVGLQAKLAGIYSTPYYLAGIFPSTDNKWKKFYLGVADFNAQYQGTSYNFYIKAVLNPGQTSGRLLIDNVYLITLAQ